MWYNKYVGIPFKEKGRDAQGVDCWGLLQLVFHKERGIELPDYLNLYESTLDKSLASIIEREKQGRWRAVTKPIEFDAVILRMRGVPMHIGIVTKNGYMIHSVMGSNVAHERYDSIRWRSKVVGFERYA